MLGASVCRFHGYVFSLLDQFWKALEEQQKAAEEAEEAKRKAASGPQDK